MELFIVVFGQIVDTAVRIRSNTANPLGGTALLEMPPQTVVQPRTHRGKAVDLKLNPLMPQFYFKGKVRLVLLLRTSGD